MSANHSAVLHSFQPRRSVSSRIARWRVDPRVFFLAWTTGVTIEIHQGLPPDVTIRNIWFAQDAGVFDILLEHSSFDLIQEGCEVPLLDFRFAAKFGSTQPQALAAPAAAPSKHPFAQHSPNVSRRKFGSGKPLLSKRHEQK
jgi:hypothetical protein